ncbi:MAG: hypothetical protein Q9192_005345 [Flavoplaca navasiana]
MFSSFLLLNLCLSSLYTLSSSQGHNATLPQKGFPYKLPDGYSIERTSGVGELDLFYAYGAIHVSMIELATKMPPAQMTHRHTTANSQPTLFTMLSNRAVACRVVLAPANADWQRLIGGFSGGLSPRHATHTLPAVLETRQTSTFTNTSSVLEELTPFYASDWYGPESALENFFMALATMIVMVSDFSDKDKTINHQQAEKYGYDFNVTYVPLPSQDG